MVVAVTGTAGSARPWMWLAQLRSTDRYLGIRRRLGSSLLTSDREAGPGQAAHSSRPSKAPKRWLLLSVSPRVHSLSHQGDAHE